MKYLGCLTHRGASESSTLACPKIGLDAIACPLDRSTGTRLGFGRHDIKNHPHPLTLDASGENYLLDSFLFKMVRQQPIPRDLVFNKDPDCALYSGVIGDTRNDFARGNQSNIEIAWFNV